MHRHNLKLRPSGVWFYKWDCGCGFRYVAPKTYFRLLLLGKVN